VIPIRDINPVHSRPIVVYTLIAMNAAVWLFQISLLMSGGEPAMKEFVLQYGAVPAYLAQGEHLTSYVTPFTSMFMHGGWFHVIGNMWFLWVFGDNVEDALGKVRFVIFYILCGLVAVAAQVAIDPSSPVPMVGASGAIAGVLGAYVLLYPGARVVTLVPIFIFIHFIELPAYLFIFVWFGMQLLYGYASLGQIGEAAGGTAFWAHIGGFVAGLAFIALTGRRGKRGPRTERRIYHRARKGNGQTPWGRDRHRPR